MAVTADPSRHDRTGVWLALAGVALLLGGLYAAGVVFLGTRIPAGTEVVGVDIGGLEQEAARERLGDAMDERLRQPVTLTLGERTVEVEPADAGISVDVDATVAEAGGERTWNPVQMLDVLVGADDVDPVLDVDAAALDERMAAVAKRFDRQVVEPEVTFTRSGERTVVRPRSGRVVDADATGEALTAAFVEGADEVEIVAQDIAPAVGAGALDDALRDLATPAVSGPITLQLGDERVDLPVATFAPALTLQVDGDALVPVFDTELLDRRLEPVREQVATQPEDAAVVLQGGEPVVVPAQPGLTVRAENLAEAITPVLSETGRQRRAEVGTEVAQADFTTREARRLRIEEEVSRFVTYFPYAEYRNVNQSRAAELINGTVLEPGETFSFNETVGERTEANGFVPGFIISNGVFQEDLGGGVSQVVTTAYNAAFFAGLEDVEHKPHSFYIDRYPVGREATVAWPTVDLKFKNNTPYGVLIEAFVVNSTPSSQGEMHVRMWSKPYWDIEAGTSARYNFTSPSTRYDPTDTCVATTGYGGFDVDVMRYVRRVGSDELIRTEVDKVTYTPADTVICT